MPLPDRVRLVVLFGGRSAEHDISRISASHVLRAVDPDRYEVLPVGIARDGRWVLAEQAAELLGRGLRDELPASIPVAGPDVDPLPTLTDRALAQDAGVPGPVTVVLPILHGPYGEDGTVQGLLEMAGLPYVGAGVLGSAVAMDKAMSKTVLDAAGIAQPAWRSVRAAQVRGASAGDRLALARQLLADLGDTVFVKPANMGSSIGVARATGDEALLDALDAALAYDDRAVVEEAVRGRELEVAVLGNDHPRASVVGEILPAAEFYDYEDKYTDGAARTVVPAELDGDVADELRHLAVRTFLTLRAEGMARVDVFLEHDGPDGPGRGILVNEINTIPGFTPISMYPMLWQESGLSYSELIDELVALALERHERRARHRTDVQRRTSSATPAASP
ncbi:MAG: D-alanine--D-alanine ligase family protein [Microthrixaceae bacterium]